MAKKESELDKYLAKVAKTPAQITEFQKDLPVYSTGVFGMDLAMSAIDPVFGNGGIRSRDMFEIAAPNNSCKTAVMFAHMAYIQRRYPGDGVCMVAYTPEMPDQDQFRRMRIQGVDPERVAWIGLECSGNKALEQLLHLVREFDEIKAAVIDSVAAIPIAANEDKTLEDSEAVAATAKVFNPFSKRFIVETKTASLLYLNHYRPPVQTGGRPGSTKPPSVLDPDTVGGKTKDFLGKGRWVFSSNPKWEKDNKNSITDKNMINELKVTAKLVRNKYGPSGREIEFTYNLDDFTFNNEEVTIKYASAFAEKQGDKWRSNLSIPVYVAGSYYTIGEYREQGIKGAIQYLRENPEIMYQIQREIMQDSRRFFTDKIEIEEEIDKD